MRYKVLTASLVVICLIGATIYFVQERKASAAYTCVAGPEEVCASASFYADVQRMRTLENEIAKGDKLEAQTGKFTVELEAKKDQLSGMDRRLGQIVQNVRGPKGEHYVWSNDKNRLVWDKTQSLTPITQPNPAPVVPAK